MQGNLTEPSELPPLPEPGLLELWVYEQPLLPAIVLIFLAITVLFVLRHSKRLKSVGLPVAAVALLIGASIMVLGSTTTTDRELLKERSRALVRSVADSDETALRELLNSEARLASVFASAEGADRIVSIATTRNPGVVRSAEVGEVNAGLFGPQVATTQIRVRTKGEFIPSLSWWRVDWARTSDTSSAWLVTHIEPIWIQGFNDPGPRN